MRTLKPWIILAAVCLPVFCQAAPLAGNLSASDKLVAVSFKAMAKAFLAVSDVNKLKKDSIARVEKMNEGKFRKKYSRAYPILRTLPAALKKEYAVSEDMDKAQAIANLRSLNKDRAYQLIDQVPDQTVVMAFKEYGRRSAAAKNNEDISVRIRWVWNKIMLRVRGR